MAGVRWQVVGSAAEIYDEFLVPAVFGPWAGILVEAAGVGAGDRVVDVACGTGVAALCAARAVSPGGVVTGIDLNPGMIAVARDKEMPAEKIGGKAMRLRFPWQIGAPISFSVN